jgi:ATP-dependent DNA ligase
VAAIATLPARSCLINGEAIVSDESGLAVFDLIRAWPTNLSAVLCAFDLWPGSGPGVGIERGRPRCDGAYTR